MFLLDTHVMLWWWTEPERLPESLLEVLGNPETEIIVSAISAYEIAYKHNLGKLISPQDLLSDFEQAVVVERWTPLPVSMAHCLAAGRLESLHRDPFDRLLAAQCVVETAVLVTADPAFSQFAGVSTLWE